MRQVSDPVGERCRIWSARLGSGRQIWALGHAEAWLEDDCFAACRYPRAEKAFGELAEPGVERSSISTTTTPPRRLRGASFACAGLHTSDTIATGARYGRCRTGSLRRAECARTADPELAVPARSSRAAGQARLRFRRSYRLRVCTVPRLSRDASARGRRNEARETESAEGKRGVDAGHIGSRSVLRRVQFPVAEATAKCTPPC
jgi:hypothetical protein